MVKNECFLRFLITKHSNFEYKICQILHQQVTNGIEGCLNIFTFILCFQPNLAKWSSESTHLVPPCYTFENKNTTICRPSKIHPHSCIYARYIIVKVVDSTLATVATSNFHLWGHQSHHPHGEHLQIEVSAIHTTGNSCE